MIYKYGLLLSNHTYACNRVDILAEEVDIRTSQKNESISSSYNLLFNLANKRSAKLENAYIFPQIHSSYNLTLMNHFIITGRLIPYCMIVNCLLYPHLHLKPQTNVEYRQLQYVSVSKGNDLQKFFVFQILFSCHALSRYILVLRMHYSFTSVGHVTYPLFPKLQGEEVMVDVFLHWRQIDI